MSKKNGKGAERPRLIEQAKALGISGTQHMTDQQLRDEIGEAKPINPKPGKKGTRPGRAQAKKETPKKEVKGGNGKPPAVAKAKELSRYGHKLETMTALVDDLVWKGCTIETGAEAIEKKFGKSHDYALRRFRKLAGRLPRFGGVKVEIKEDHYKALTERI